MSKNTVTWPRPCNLCNKPQDSPEERKRHMQEAHLEFLEKFGDNYPDETLIKIVPKAEMTMEELAEWVKTASNPELLAERSNFMDAKRKLHVQDSCLDKKIKLIDAQAKRAAQEYKPKQPYAPLKPLTVPPDMDVRAQEEARNVQA